MFLFRVSRYLKYIMVSQNRRGHGIHSPFVFDLVSRVFRNKTDKEVVCKMEKIRKNLMKDKRIIEVKDLGSGSEGKNNFRKVSDIVRSSAVTEKYGVLLAKLAAEYAAPLVIEFGTSLGISTMYLSSAKGRTQVFSMEGCPATAEIASENFRENGCDNIRLFTGPFEESLADIIETGISPGLVFIDGNHRKGPVLDYFDKIASISDSNSVIIIDDIRYSREMEEAWDEIKLHEKVTFTIDIFRMGIVFFRKGIAHNNYIIRY